MCLSSGYRFLWVILMCLAMNVGLVRAETVVINEFMASNGSSKPIEQGELIDEDGDSSDWIEIQNTTDQAIDISGWYLTDDAADLTQWQFPAGLILEPGQPQIVFASGKDRSDPVLHTNFKLSSEGEYIGLVLPDGQTVAHEYTPQYPAQLSDVSYGLAERQVSLVHPSTALTYHIPGPADAGLDWMSPEFDDGQWHTAYTTLGFSETKTLVPLDIGPLTVPGSYVVNEAFHVLTAGGAGLGFSSDAFQFVYAMLKGDNELSARIIAISHSPASVKTGLMVRESLSAEAKYVAQMVTPDHGAAFQYRASTGGSSILSPGDATLTPLWVRIVRQGSKVYGYISDDGTQWRLQGVKTVAMAENIYVGLFQTTGSDSTLTTGIFDHVSFGSNAGAFLQKNMMGTHASLWTRAKFDIDEIDSHDYMSLHMRHEDGFVAYLNGVEIARDNYTGSPQWDSVADSNRPDDLSQETVEYDLSSFTDLLQLGTNVLAVQTLNDNVADPTFHMSPQLVTQSEGPLPQYFETATPGLPNEAGTLGVVQNPQFSVVHGFYESPFELEILTNTQGASVRYTIDGTAPSAVYGQLYTEPIQISTTTCIRAIVSKPGWMSSKVNTQTYIFLDDVLQQPSDPPGFPTEWKSNYYKWSYSADYAMDPSIVNHANYASRIKDDLKSLPTMSLVMDQYDLFDPNTGVYANTNLNHPGGVDWERPGSVELIQPDGSQGFHINCGVRVVGGWGAKPEYRKHSFRLMFKRQYGPSKLSYPLFGPDAADEFDTVTLRANFNDCYVAGGSNSQYIRDEFCRRLQLSLGQRAGSGTFVHLYVNGLYWGLYNPVERPDAAFAATYFGGDKEDWNAYNSGRTTGESTGESWSGMLSAVGEGFSTAESYQHIQGNNPDGTPNPEHIPWLDMENYVDYMIMNFYVGNRDWPGHNWYAAFNKMDPTGFKCFSWDAEHVMGLNSDLNANQTGVSGSLATPYARLRVNPEFKLYFGDRVHKAFFNGGPCYVDPAHPEWDPLYPERNQPAALYADLADWVESGMVGESARWGDVRGGRYNLDDWKQRRDWLLQTYLPQRSAIVLSQFRQAGLYPSVDAPMFYFNGATRHEGYADTGDLLFMLAPQGDIYYTLDGTDPHRPVVPQILNASTLVPVNAPKKALVPTTSIGNTWRSNVNFNDTVWLSSHDAKGVGYERNSGYDAYFDMDVLTPMNGRNASCYVRIPFIVSSAQLDDLNYMSLKMRYDDGFVAYINGIEVMRANASGTPSWNSTASAGHSDGAAVNFEDFDVTDHIDALRAGDNLLAIHGLNVSVTSSDFLIGAQLVSGTLDITGDMFSPSAIPYTEPIALNKVTHLTARALNGSTWSAVQEATFGINSVPENLRLTEIMYHPIDPNAEYIELQNIGPDSINLDRVEFVRGIDFVFPDLELVADEFILVVKDTVAFKTRYPQISDSQIAGEYRGGLSDGGERIELQDALGQVIHDFRYRDDWHNTTDGLGMSLTVKEPASTNVKHLSLETDWVPSTSVGGSPGAADTLDPRTTLMKCLISPKSWDFS